MIRIAAITAAFLSALLSLSGCMHTDVPGGLVPPTVIEDEKLPSITISVAGAERSIHFRTFGDDTNPPLFILHGSLSDMRAYLPLQIFSDKYYVVLWDMRGNGLSERVPKEELSPHAMVEEIESVRRLFAPHRRITLFGHSWSAVFVALYLGKYPENVEQAVMAEPFGLTSAIQQHADVPMNLISEGYLDMAFASGIMTPKDHESLDYMMLAMLHSGVRDYFCDVDHLPEWPVWRVGGSALLPWEGSIIDGGAWSYDFSKGLDDFPRTVLLIGSSCSPIGYSFQTEYNASVFPSAETAEIKNSGHRIVTEQFDQLVETMKGYLSQYGGPK
jgi:proline iminopeptidase